MITAVSNVTVNRTEYSRYYRAGLDGTDYGIIGVTATVTGTSGDFAYLTISNLRTLRPVVSKMYVLGTTGANSISFNVDLGVDATDADGAYWATQGRYKATVSAASDGSGIGASCAPFLISVAPAVELRERWLSSIPLRNENVLEPYVRNITGITPISVRDVQRGGYSLTYNATTRAIVYDNGPAYIAPGSGTVTVDLWNETMDQTVEVTITAASLPGVDTSGYLFVDWGRISDEVLRTYLSAGYAYMEKFLQVPLEPKLAVTPRLVSSYPYQEKVIDGPPFRPAKSGLMAPVGLGLRRVIKLYSIKGWQSDTQTLDLPASWAQVDGLNGIVSFVPSLSGVYPAPVFLGPGGISGTASMAYIQRILPNFWQFAAAYGLRNLDSASYGETCRQGVLRYAAVEALLVAGRAQAGILSAVTVSRDGASFNKNYTGGQFGVYSDMVQQHSQWFVTNMPSLRQQVEGVVVSRG